MSLRLLSFDICPYVQRSAIALQEKGVPYETAFIDLANKPDWFLKLSPHGKVPVLQVGDTVLFESLVILEYLDETQPPQLHQSDPLEKARDRAWFSVADNALVSIYRMMISQDRDQLGQHAAALRTQLAKLEPELKGPLWRGQAFTAMDAVTYPALQRARWLDLRHPELRLFRDLPAVDRWEKALADRPSVQRSTVPDIHDRFVKAIASIGPVHA